MYSLILNIVLLLILNRLLSFTLIKKIKNILVLRRSGVRTIGRIVDYKANDENTPLITYNRIIEFETFNKNLQRVELVNDNFWIIPKLGKELTLFYDISDPENFILLKSTVYNLFLILGVIVSVIVNILLVLRIISEAKLVFN
jgi:hypothetical protein